MMLIEASARRRFWKKVRIDPTSGCWIWRASVRRWSREPWDGGYGAFWFRGSIVRAHIFAYWLLFGGIPKGKVLLHKCDNRRCVNVLKHIRPGTQVENIRDMLRKGRAKHQRNGTIPKETRDAKEAEVDRGCPEQSGAGQDRDLPGDPFEAVGRPALDRRDPGEAGPA